MEAALCATLVTRILDDPNESSCRRRLFRDGPIRKLSIWQEQKRKAAAGCVSSIPRRLLVLA